MRAIGQCVAFRKLVVLINSECRYGGSGSTQNKRAAGVLFFYFGEHGDHGVRSTSL